MSRRRACGAFRSPPCSPARSSCRRQAATFAGVDVPPPLPPQPVVDVHWGVSVEDPYRFLENTADPAVQAWMKKQADATASILAQLPGRDRLRARLAEIDAEIPAVVSRVHRDARGRLTYLKRTAADNQLKLYRRDTLDGAERLLVDPDAIAKATGKAHAIGSFEPSPDGALVAYTLSASGAEIGTLHVIDAATGKEVTPAIDRIRGGGMQWLPDSSGFFHGRLAPDWQTRPRAERFMDHRTYLRRLAQPDADRVVFGPGVHDSRSARPQRRRGRRSGARAGHRLRGRLPRRPEGTVAVPRFAEGRPGRHRALDQGVRRRREGPRRRLRRTLAVPAQRERRAALQAAAPADRRRRWPTAQTVVEQTDRVLTGFVAARDGVYVTRRDGVVEGLERADARRARRNSRRSSCRSKARWDSRTPTPSRTARSSRSAAGRASRATTRSTARRRVRSPSFPPAASTRRTASRRARSRSPATTASRCRRRSSWPGARSSTAAIR